MPRILDSELRLSLYPDYFIYHLRRLPTPFRAKIFVQLIVYSDEYYQFEPRFLELLQHQGISTAFLLLEAIQFEKRQEFLLTLVENVVTKFALELLHDTFTNWKVKPIELLTILRQRGARE